MAEMRQEKDSWGWWRFRRGAGEHSGEAMEWFSGVVWGQRTGQNN
jgi:hypothetical protein